MDDTVAGQPVRGILRNLKEYIEEKNFGKTGEVSSGWTNSAMTTYTDQT
jgi:hypothetical protein